MSKSCSWLEYFLSSATQRMTSAEGSKLFTACRIRILGILKSYRPQIAHLAPPARCLSIQGPNHAGQLGIVTAKQTARRKMLTRPGNIALQAFIRVISVEENHVGRKADISQVGAIDFANMHAVNRDQIAQVGLKLFQPIFRA